MSEETQKENDSKNMTYKDAGVDVDAGAELVLYGPPTSLPLTLLTALL